MGSLVMDPTSPEPGLENAREMPLDASDGWPDLKGIHVMLIEDNSDTRLMVDEVLRHCGAVVTTYESAEVALQHLSEFMPMVFICDLSMPGLDGMQFMKRLRALPPERGANTPALACTAYDEQYAASAAQDAGFNAYLTKPLRLDLLCTVVKELAARATKAPKAA
jgi:CheY-like chemotaxis protein